MRTTVLIFLTACAVFAQSPDWKTATGAAKGHFNQISNLIQRSAEKMPEENYSFKPSPDVRSYGAILGHIADAQYTFCSAATGETNPRPGIEKGKTSKADLTAALKDAFNFCEKAYDGLTEANMNQLVKFFGGERSKLNVLTFNNIHNMEHYGNLVTYLRIKGIVPPSSEPRK